MEERGNKTIMCSVFFLDIVGYSKKSVTGQISLKERFNGYLSAAISDVPITDRIILDTGDGAAINFLGDIEDALKAALSLRESLLNEDPSIEHPLLVRMGINLGPVRLVRDINGQPNIVGDGINVAQRVMGFADASQILVSRSYYDAVSRISPQYAGMFHYQGSRTDKHVREHEVYAIGYPGDKTTLRRSAGLFLDRTESPFGKTLAYSNTVLRPLFTRLDALKEQMITRFREAEPKQRAIYVGVGAIPLLLLITLLVKLAGHDEIPAMPAGINEQAGTAIQSGSAVAGMPSQSGVLVAPATTVGSGGDAKKDGMTHTLSKADGQHIAESKEAKAKKAKRPEVQPKSKSQNAAASDSGVAVPTNGSGAYISVRCLDGTEVFLDGTRKGRISGTPLIIKGTPGSHALILSHPQGIDSRNVVLEEGKTLRINPGFCN